MRLKPTIAAIWTSPLRIGGPLLALAVFLICLPMTPLSAQVINANSPQDSLWVGVGPDSADFAAQSFMATVKRVRKIGVWLKGVAGTGEVRISLVKDLGNNQPDLNFVLHESTIIMPDTGSWVWDSTFSAALTVGERYWIVVDGYNNLIGTGYAAVGTSQTYTNTGDPMRYSTDGGTVWASVSTIPMAVFVEGDNCNINLAITPVQPLLCPGGTVSFGVPTGFVSYSWATGQTSASITVGNTGIYSVSVIDVASCVASASVLVLQGTIPYSGLFDLYETCEGIPLELELPVFYQDYQWSTGATSIDETFLQGGIYWASITSNTNCTLLDSFQVVVRPYAAVDLGRDSSLCVGDTIILDGGPAMATYVWSTGNYTRMDTLVASTNAWLQVVDSFGCITWSDTVDYTFNPIPARPIIQMEPNALHSSFANGYEWLFNGAVLAGESGQDIEDPQPGVYAVIISNAFGCRDTSSAVTVVAETLGDFVSGGFSPNGDGNNEVFFVEGISRYPDIHLQVFNRWGEPVYEAKPYLNDWNGTGKAGTPLPVGDYFYNLDFGAARSALHGTVMISR